MSAFQISYLFEMVLGTCVPLYLYVEDDFMELFFVFHLYMGFKDHAQSPHVCSSKCFAHWSSQCPSLTYSVTAYIGVLHRVCPAASAAVFPLSSMPCNNRSYRFF